MCLEKTNSVEMKVLYCSFFFPRFKNSTFEECDAANDCSINSDEGEGFFFVITIRAATLNCLSKAIAIISVSIFLVMFSTFLN